MKVMRRSRWLARLAAMLVVGVAGLVVAASAPARAGPGSCSSPTSWRAGVQQRGRLGRRDHDRQITVRRHQAGQRRQLSPGTVRTGHRCLPEYPAGTIRMWMGRSDEGHREQAFDYPGQPSIGCAQLSAPSCLVGDRPSIQ